MWHKRITLFRDSATKMYVKLCTLWWSHETHEGDTGYRRSLQFAYTWSSCTTNRQHKTYLHWMLHQIEPIAIKRQCILYSEGSFSKGVSFGVLSVPCSQIASLNPSLRQYHEFVLNHVHIGNLFTSDILYFDPFCSFGWQKTLKRLKMFFFC